MRARENRGNVGVLSQHGFKPESANRRARRCRDGNPKPWLGTTTTTPAEAFEASIEGAYYSKELAQAELQGRVGAFKALPELPVNTAWDLGVGDSTAIWFWQKLRDKIQLVGFYENSGEGLPHYIEVLKDYQRRHNWTYASHIVPPDARV